MVVGGRLLERSAVCFPQLAPWQMVLPPRTAIPQHELRSRQRSPQVSAALACAHDRLSCRHRWTEQSSLGVVEQSMLPPFVVGVVEMGQRGKWPPGAMAGSAVLVDGHVTGLMQ